MKRRFLIMFVFSIAVIGLISCGKKQQENSQDFMRMAGMQNTGAIPVKVDTVKIEPISSYILTNTTLEAFRQVDIIARVSGIVQKFNFEEGDYVHKGDVIAQLDDRELRLSLEQAKAKMDNTKRINDRSEEMFNKNLVSKETFDDAKFQYETAKSQYENAQLQLAYASIRAPLEGVITKRMLEIGDYVTTNQVVYTMADYDVLLARIYIPEKEVGKIKIGQKARIEVEAFPSKDFSGTVKMINPVIDPTSGTVKVTVEIQRANSGLLPGMFASVYILTDTHENARVIPKKALILESETDRVFVYDNGSAKLTDVKLGFTDGNRIEILDGVEPGEEVITVGQEGLRDGANVRIVGATGEDLKVAAVNDDPKNPHGQAIQLTEGRQQGRGGSAPGLIDPERLKMMEERMLQNPEIKKEFEKRAKQDPDFKNNPEKKMAFFREMRQKMRQ